MSNEVNPRATRALLAVGLLVGAICYSTAARELFLGGSPDAGWSAIRAPDGMRVSTVAPSGPADGVLRKGDRVLAVGGFRPAGRGLGPVALMDFSAGDRYRVTVSRDHQVLDLELSMGAPSASTSEWISRTALLLISLSFFVSGCAIGWLRPGDRVARLYMVLAVLIGIVLLPFGVFGGELRRGVGRAVLAYARAGSPIMFAASYQFFRHFPPGVRYSQPWSAIGVVLVAWCGLLVPAALTTAFVLSRPAGDAMSMLIANADWFNRYDSLSGTFIQCALVASAAVIVRNYLVIADGGQRRRLRWVMFGLLAGMLPMALAFTWSTVADVVTGIPPAYDTWIRVQSLAALPLILLPAAFAYAVMHHRVIGIDVVIRKSLQYLLARSVLRVATAVPLILMAGRAITNPHRTIAQLVLERPFYLVMVVVSALLLILRPRLIRSLDRRFFRDRAERDQILLDAIGRAAAAPDIPEATIRVMCDAVERAFHPSSLEVRLVTPEGGVGGAPEDGLVVPIGDGVPPRIGAFVLGAKKSDEPYTNDERRLLDHVAAQIALAVDRASLNTRIAASERERVGVLARVDTTFNLVKECGRCGRCYDRSQERCLDDDAPLVHPIAVDRAIQGRYRLERLIGRGGMGLVYSAVDVTLDRTVAVKLMTATDDHRRFEREARALGRVNHPHIVAVHDFGVTGSDVAFLVMEHLRGMTLRERMRREGPMSPTVVAGWLRPLAEAMIAAHTAGVIHRDLKPDNVYFADATDGVTLKVLDFGLATLSSADVSTTVALTDAGRIMGTLAYMSSEQLDGKTVDGRADVFAIGVMVVEALTGINPFLRSDAQLTIAALLHERFSVTGDSPETEALNQAVQRCCARRIEERYPDVMTLRDELLTALEACPPSMVCRLGS